MQLCTHTHAHTDIYLYKQCREKIKALKKKYKKAVDRLRVSGVGIDSDDNLDDYKLFVNFKWFKDIHSVLRRRAVYIVNPPSLLLDASQISQATTGVQSEPQATVVLINLHPVTFKPT